MAGTTTSSEKRSTKKTLFFVASYLLSFACLFYVLRGIDYRDMQDNLKHMHWGWIAIAMVADVFVYVFQGWRWSMMLRPLERIPVWRSVRAIYVGLFANELLPFRTGEIIRCYLQSRWGTLPFTVILSSALIERIFDGAWLVICMLVSLRLTSLPHRLINFGYSLGGLVLIAAVLVGAAMFWKESAYAALSRNRYTKPIAVLLEDLHIIGHSRYLYWSALASLPYLLLQVIPIYAVARAYGSIDLTMIQAFVVMVAVRLSAVVPQAPGNLGLFQTAAFMSLTALGYGSQDAKQFSLVLWAVITLPLLIGGFFAAAITGSRVNELRHEAQSNMQSR